MGVGLSGGADVVLVFVFIVDVVECSVLGSEAELVACWELTVELTVEVERVESVCVAVEALLFVLVLIEVSV